MCIIMALKANPHPGRNVSSVLGLSMLYRRHADYWPDFHTDSMTVFAYFEKPLRRLVNWHQSRYSRGCQLHLSLHEQQPAQVKWSS